MTTTGPTDYELHLQALTLACMKDDSTHETLKRASEYAKHLRKAIEEDAARRKAAKTADERGAAQELLAEQLGGDATAHRIVNALAVHYPADVVTPEFLRVKRHEMSDVRNIGHAGLGRVDKLIRLHMAQRMVCGACIRGMHPHVFGPCPSTDCQCIELMQEGPK